MSHIRGLSCTVGVLVVATVTLAAGGRAQVAAVPPPGSTVVSGQVTAANGGPPITGATVAILSLRVGAITKPDGRYSFTVPANGPATLSNVMMEKFITLFQNIEVWSDWRRTNIPVLTPFAGGTIPRRIAYQTEEVAANPSIPGPGPQRNWNDP